MAGRASEAAVAAPWVVHVRQADSWAKRTVLARATRSTQAQACVAGQVSGVAEEGRMRSAFSAYMLQLL